MQNLKNKVAVITGGANGIGKATALKFAEAGANVAIWDLQEDKGQILAQTLRDMGVQAAFYNVNTVKLTLVQMAAKKVMADFGKIDILINNAGITHDSTFLKMTEEQFDSVIDVNLKGVFNCTKAVAPFMVELGYGRIVQASSIVALYGNFGQTNYAASKSGVIGMTKVWARELGRKGITVNAVAPGFIETEMFAAIPEKVIAIMKEKVPSNCLGSAEDVANVYLFLASDEARYVNGAVISVDGGAVL